VGSEEEENTNCRFTSTIMLTLTTDNESSGTFSLFGSIRRKGIYISSFCMLEIRSFS